MVGEINRPMISSLIKIFACMTLLILTSSVSARIAGSLGWRDASLWPSELDHILKWKGIWKGIEKHLHVLHFKKREREINAQQADRFMDFWHKFDVF